MKKSKPAWARILFLIVAIYIFTLMGIAQLQEKLIFKPEVLPENFLFPFQFPFDELNVKTSDGAVLNALYIKTPHPKGIMLYFHGNKGSLRRWGNIAGGFIGYGYNILIMDYRGYGKSRGALSETALQNDARLFYEKAKSYFSEDSIVVYGRSLGCHFATLVAAENKPAQLILETPYTSMADVAQSKLPVFPIKMLIKFPFNNIPLIKKVNCPITIFHGTADMVVPYRLGKKLFETAGGGKKLITIPGGSHNNLAEYEAYRNALMETLAVPK